MPTYDYKCSSCENLQSVERPLNEADQTPKCDKCGEDLQRLFTFGAVVFRGTGWGSGQ